MIENKKVPKIRFEGFTDAWEQRKVSELINDIADGPFGSNLKTIHYTNENEARIIQLSNIGESGWLDENVRYTTFEHAKEIKRSIVKSGELVMAKMMPAGLTIECPDIDKMYVLSSDTVRINLNEELVDTKYFVSMTKSDCFLDQINNDMQGSTRTRTSISKIRKMNIPTPSLSEQQKIGLCFQQLDNLTTFYQSKCDKLVVMKKSMLEKMFPENGSNVPEIRIAGFTDAWEQRKFDEMAEYKKGPFGSALKKDIFVPKSPDAVKVYEQQNAINKNWKLERYFITKDYANKLSAFETCAGDIIVSCAGTIGEMYELPIGSESGVINQALMRVRTNNNVVDRSFYQILFLNMIDNFTKEYSNGSAMKNIPPFADLKPMVALVPKMQEQKKISCYFQTFDNLITLHQRKLEILKKIKKAMLEKMFV